MKARPRAHVARRVAVLAGSIPRCLGGDRRCRACSRRTSATSADRIYVASRWVLPALVAVACCSSLWGPMAYGGGGATVLPRILLPHEAGPAAPGGHPRADAARSARGSSPSRHPTLSAATSSKDSTSPPPTAPPKNFCAICSSSSDAALAAASQVAVGEFLHQCDFVKFAAHVADSAEHGIAAPRVRARSCCATARNADRMIRFLQPEWFWLMTLLPLVMLWRGRRGPVAAIEYSDVSLAREVARRGRSRIGCWVWLLPIRRRGLDDRRARPPAAHARPHRSHRQRHRHRAGTGRLRFDAGARFHASNTGASIASRWSSRWSRNSSTSGPTIASGSLRSPACPYPGQSDYARS